MLEIEKLKMITNILIALYEYISVMWDHNNIPNAILI